MEYLVLGFFTGLSLILAIGAQNIFVIEQGLKKQHVFLVCLVCSLSDLLLIFSLIGCSSSDSSIETDKIFTIEEIKSSGFKLRGDFDSNFQGSTNSVHGFYKGREVAFIVYPSLDLAKTNGIDTANEQTEMIEIVEKNIGHGPNV